MATPHVAGAAALLAAYDPSLSAVALKATLMNTVDPLTGWESTPIKTNGRLNVFAALQNRTSCTVQLDKDHVLISRKGGYADIGVSTPANCDRGITSDSRWIRIIGDGVSSGSQPVRVFIDPSYYLSRKGNLKIGEVTVEVRQGHPSTF